MQSKCILADDPGGVKTDAETGSTPKRVGGKWAEKGVGRKKGPGVFVGVQGECRSKSNSKSLVGVGRWLREPVENEYEVRGGKMTGSG